MTVAELDYLKPAAMLIKSLPQVLAVEFLDKKRVFGDKASIKEMQKFKSRVKKVQVKGEKRPSDEL